MYIYRERERERERDIGSAGRAPMLAPGKPTAVLPIIRFRKFQSAPAYHPNHPPVVKKEESRFLKGGCSGNRV